MLGVRVDIIIGKLEWGFSEIEVATMVVVGEELLVQEGKPWQERNESWINHVRDKSRGLIV